MSSESNSSNLIKLTVILLFFITASVNVRNAGYGFIRTDEAPALKTMARPRYTDDKRLILPEGYGAWVFVGASIGLAYSDEARGDGPGLFHRVYTQPEAYAEYQRAGKFPEKTMFVMELYRPEQKVSPNKQGYFEGERVAIEVSVKDREVFSEGWAYFNFGNGRRTEARPIPKASCYDCHREHGANDNVFTQFYPALRNVKKTVSTPTTETGKEKNQ
ncbi:MAG: cytochrome P460 family protein [Blastocatellales bacterium]